MVAKNRILLQIVFEFSIIKAVLNEIAKQISRHTFGYLYAIHLLQERYERRKV